MVRAASILTAFALGSLAAAKRHASYRFPWEKTESSETDLVVPTQTKTGNGPRATNFVGDHKAYLHHGHAQLNPTTLITITTSAAGGTSSTLAATAHEVKRRQLGGLLGGLGGLGGLGTAGGLGGVVSNLLGGLQPAVTAALAPIQSAANTNLAQLSLVKSLAPNVVPTANVIGPAATAAGPVLGNLLGGIMSAVAPLLTDAGALATQIEGPLQSLAGPIESAVAGPLTAAVGPLISALAPAVAAGLAPVATLAGGALQPLASDLIEPIESAVAPLLAGVVSAAVSAIGGVEDPLAAALQPVLNGVDTAILPLVSAAVSAVWPAIAPIVTPLNPVICALQPAEVPIGGNDTALIPVQCVSVTSGNMVPVSTGVATVTSPQGLLSITPASLAPLLSTSGVPNGANIPMPAAPAPSLLSSTTALVSPGPSGSNADSSASLASSPGPTVSRNPPPQSTASNPPGSTNPIAASVSPAPPAATSNPLGSAAAAASTFLAGLGTASSVFGVSVSLPSIDSVPSSASSIADLPASTSSGNVIPPSPPPPAPASGGPSLLTVQGAVTAVLTALPAVAPSTTQIHDQGVPSMSTEQCMMMASNLMIVPASNLLNIPMRVGDPSPPASPLPVTDSTVSDQLPPVGGTVPAATPMITPPPGTPASGLIMLAYGSQTITFSASQLPGGGLVASMSGNIYAFPPASTALARRGRRGKRADAVGKPNYEALALALVSLLTQSQQDSSIAQEVPLNTPKLADDIASFGTWTAPMTASFADTFTIPESHDAYFPTQIDSSARTSAGVTDSVTSSIVTSVTTSATSTNSVDTSASGASLSIPTCPDINGTSYLSNGGSVYHIICGLNWVGRDIQPWRSAPDFDSCVANCDSLNAGSKIRPCAAALFVPDAPASAANCYPKYSVDNPTNNTSGFTFQAAVLVSSGIVVDNGVSMPVGHAEIPEVKDQGQSPVDIDAALMHATKVYGKNDTSDSTTTVPGSPVLDLTSTSALGGLNVSNDFLSSDPFGSSSNGILVVYATGTNIVEPVLSTTMMLGAASNSPATRFFAVNPSPTSTALAKRNKWLPEPERSSSSDDDAFWPLEQPDVGRYARRSEQASSSPLNGDDAWLSGQASSSPPENDERVDLWLLEATSGSLKNDEMVDAWLPAPPEALNVRQSDKAGTRPQMDDDTQMPENSSDSQKEEVFELLDTESKSVDGITASHPEKAGPSGIGLADSMGSVASSLAKRPQDIQTVTSGEDVRTVSGTSFAGRLAQKVFWLIYGNGTATTKPAEQHISRNTSSETTHSPSRLIGTRQSQRPWSHSDLAPWKFRQDELSSALPTMARAQHTDTGFFIGLTRQSPTSVPQWIPCIPDAQGKQSEDCLFGVDIDPGSAPGRSSLTSSKATRGYHPNPSSWRALSSQIVVQPTSQPIQSVNKRQIDMDVANPNAYTPVSNTTGANFALADAAIDPMTGILSSNSTTEAVIQDLTNVPHISRDSGKGGMVGGHHVFAFADTGVYTSQLDGSNGHYLGYASSSVAIDVGQHGLFGNPLTLQDGVGEFADATGNLRGFIPLTIGETAWNSQAVAAGVSSRYAIWPESSFIPLTANESILFAPIVYDVVDPITKSADFTYTGNTLISVTANDSAGPVAQRVVGRLFNATDVEWGCVGGIRSWGDSGVGGEDGLVYLFGSVRGGLLVSRVNAIDVSMIDAYEYWDGKDWTSGALAPDSTAYILEGSFMDVDIFYSPRHLTFIAVYTKINGDNTVYWKYLDTPQAILPSYAGGDSDSDMVEAITKYTWSDEHTLFKMGAGLNGDYSYAAGVHLGYFGQNDILNGGEKMLLTWTSPTGQDPASSNSAYQLMSGVVTWQ